MRIHVSLISILPLLILLSRSPPLVTSLTIPTNHSNQSLNLRSRVSGLPERTASFQLLNHNFNVNDSLKLNLVHIAQSNCPSHPLLLDFNRVTSLHRRLKSPLTSGAAVGSGQYFAGVSFGSPPQPLLLVVDTGSDLTWLRCPTSGHRHNHHFTTFLPRRSSSFAPTHCFNPACKLVPHPNNKPHHCIKNHSSRAHTPCHYSYSYSDGSHTSGIFAQETASLNSTSGKPTRVHGIRFGCGFHVSGTSLSSSIGVMGLGRGPISFSAQLGRQFGNRFSYCLMDYTLSPPPISFLLFGGNNDVVKRKTRLQSTPLISSALSPTFYYVGIKAVLINNVKLRINPSVWALDDLGNGGTIIDSGTTLSFVPQPAYKKILAALRHRIRLSRLSQQTSGFDLCYNVSGVARPSFPRLSFQLFGDSVFDAPPGNYFIVTEDDVMCLALQGVNSASGFGVIGNLMQQGFLMEFDNDRSRLYFSRNGCGQLS